jgi:hypothetical protein
MDTTSVYFEGAGDKTLGQRGHALMMSTKRDGGHNDTKQNAEIIGGLVDDAQKRRSTRSIEIRRCRRPGSS